MHSKTMKLIAIRNEPKRTISASGGLGLLQIVSKLDTERYANEDTGPPMDVDCEILNWLEMRTKHSL